MINFIFWISWSVLMAASLSSENEKQMLDYFLPKDYDPQIAPFDYENGPVHVEVAIAVLSLRSLSEQKLMYTADLFVHFIWYDQRLNVTFKPNTKVILREDWRNKLWRPEVVFKNGVNGEFASNLFRTSYFVVNENKRIFQASRITVDLLCDFDFRNYPHDSNICPVDVMAFSYPTSKMELTFHNFSLSRHLYNNDFTITRNANNKTCNGNNEVGKFSCIRGEIRFDRNYGHFLIKTYVPSCIIVFTAMVGFWLDSNAYPPRISLYMSAMIALFTMQIQTTSTIKPSYVISIQIWMTSCVVFVFICLLEFLIASTIQLKHQQLKAERIKETTSGNTSLWSPSQPNELAMHKIGEEERSANQPNPVKKGLMQKLKLLWDRNKRSLINRGYDGHRVDNLAKFWVTILFMLWIAIYIGLVYSRSN